MKYNLKRMLSVFLAVTMVTGLAPVPAWAGNAFTWTFSEGGVNIIHECTNPNPVLEVERPATDTQEGLIVASCENCSDSDSRVIPMVTQDWFDVILEDGWDGTLDGKEHYIQCIPADGTVMASDGNVYEYSQLLSPMTPYTVDKALTYTLIRNNGCIDSDGSEGEPNFAWDETSIIHLTNFYLTNHSVTISPFEVTDYTLGSNSQSYFIADGTDLASTLSSGHYINMHGDEVALNANIYHADYEVTDDGLKYVTTQNSDGVSTPLTSVTDPGVYTVFYTIPVDAEDDDGDQVRNNVFEGGYTAVYDTVKVYPSSIPTHYIGTTFSETVQSTPSSDLWDFFFAAGETNTYKTVAGTYNPKLVAIRRDNLNQSTGISFAAIDELTLTTKYLKVNSADTPTIKNSTPTMGDSFDSLGLGTATKVHLYAAEKDAYYSKDNIPIIWNTSDYDPTKLGQQTITGQLDFSSWYTVDNSNNIGVSVTVNVQPANSTINWENKTVTYTGNPISHEIPETEGVASVVYNYQNDKYNSSTPPTMPGIYVVTATITMEDGYSAVDPISSTLTINKTTQTLPEESMTPLFASATTTSITLQTPTDDIYEYGIMLDGGYVWQDSPTFEGLESGTSYTFVQRLKASETAAESNISNGGTFSTKTAVNTNVSCSISAVDMAGTVISVIEGETVVLKATATHLFPDGASVAYQWYKDEVAIDGETSQTITLSEIADSGFYHCVVTVTLDEDIGSGKSGTIQVNISEASDEPETPQELVFPMASDIVIGEPLRRSTLSGGSSGGTFAWEDPSIVPAAGDGYYNVVFTPNDDNTTDYSAEAGYDASTNTVTRQVLVTVAQKTAIDLDVLEALPLTKVYDGTTVAVINAANAITIDREDDAAITISGTYDTANAGENKTVTLTFSISGEDAELYKTPGTITMLGDITKKPLTVTANDVAVKYGDALTDNGVEVSGIINGESIGDFGGVLDYDFDGYEQWDDIPNEDLEITPFGLNARNYEITYNPGTLTVEKNTLYVVPDDWQYKFYGDSDPSIMFSVYHNYSNTIPDIVQQAINSLGITVSRATGEDVGEYTYEIQVETSPRNFELVLDDYPTFKVQPRTVDVIWTIPEALVYTGFPLNHSVSARYENINGETIDADITFYRDNTKSELQEAGTYEVIASTTDTNYILTNEAKQITVTTSDSPIVTPNPADGIVIDYKDGTIHFDEDRYDVIDNEGNPVSSGDKISPGQQITVVDKTTGNHASIDIVDAVQPPNVELRGEIINTTDDMEYSVDGGNTWQPCPENMNVSDFAGREILIRYPADEDSFASEPVRITVPNQADTAPDVTLGDGIINTTDDMEYSIDGGETWYPCTDNMDAEDFAGMDILIRFPAAGDTPASNSVLISVPESGQSDVEAPDVELDMESETINTSIDMEYSVDGGNTWYPCPDDMSISDFIGQDILIRYPASENEQESEPVLIQVPDRIDGQPNVEWNTDGTIGTTSDMEYSVDGGETWQQCPENMNMTNFAGQNILVRYPAENGKLPSKSVLIQVPRTNNSAPDIKVDFNKGTINTTKSMEYSPDGGITWYPCIDNMNIIDFAGKGLLIRYPANEHLAPSESVSINIPSLPAAPTLHIDYSENGKPVITGLTDKMEWSADGGITWTSCTGDTLSNLSEGIYIIRVQATDTTLAGFMTVIKIADNSAEDSNDKNDNEDDNDEGKNKEHDGWANGNGYHNGTKNNEDIKNFYQNQYEHSNSFNHNGFISIAGVPDNTAGTRYDDVYSDMSSLSQSAINFTAGNRLMTGINKNEWAPNEAMTRAMFISVLHRMVGAPTGYNIGGMPDVDKDNWYYDAVAWGMNLGITNGTGETTFSPNKAITFEEMAVMIFNLCNAYGLTMMTSSTNTLVSDNTDVHDYAQAAVNAVSATGIFNINGVTSIHAADTLTRAEAAQVITNFCMTYINIY